MEIQVVLVEDYGYPREATTRSFIAYYGHLSIV